MALCRCLTVDTWIVIDHVSCEGDFEICSRCKTAELPSPPSEDHKAFYRGTLGGLAGKATIHCKPGEEDAWSRQTHSGGFSKVRNFSAPSVTKFICTWRVRCVLAQLGVPSAFKLAWVNTKPEPLPYSLSLICIRTAKAGN